MKYSGKRTNVDETNSKEEKTRRGERQRQRDMFIWMREEVNTV